MKLLILTQYFPPEVGAPQNRLFELAIRLQKSGIDATILTAMPNYPSMEIHEAYKGLKYHYEEINNLKVHRSSIYVSKSKSIFKRLLNYFSFVWFSYKMGRSKLDKSYDFILCESPPLFLGISAYLLCRKKSAKLIFNVSDLWPESAEKLGLVKNKLFLGLAYKLEAFLYKKSVLVTGQTQGIVKDIQSRFPDVQTHWLPNGVDTELFNPDAISSQWREENGFSTADLLLFYGGILGHAQGLEVILKAAALLKDKANIKFILMGSGPEKDNLLNLKEQLNLDNVYFFDTVSKEKMLPILKSIDVSIIPLKKLKLFEGAIPSKIFENLSMQNPILLGVDGEAKKLFIDDGKAGLHFEPENEQDLKSKILELYENRNLIKELGNSGRDYVVNKFNRNNIAKEFSKKLPLQ